MLRNILLLDVDIYVVKATLFQTVFNVQTDEVPDVIDHVATFILIESLSNYLSITCLHDDLPAVWELEFCDSFLKFHPWFLSLSFSD